MISIVNNKKVLSFFCKILLVGFFVFFVNDSSAQTMLEPEEDNKEVKEGEGARKYWEELERLIQQSNSRNGISINNRPAARVQEFENTISMRAPNSNNGSWTQVTQSNTDQEGGGMGRVEDVAFDPTNPNIFYVATAGGGLWKTINNGTNFFSLTSAIPATGIGSVVVDYSNVNTIYIFSGGAQGSYSAGIYKSIDGGSTWAPTGLRDSINGLTPMVGYDLKMHPTNSNMLFAATNKGLYRTSNGGSTWQKVLINPVFDVEFKTNNANIVYASRYFNIATSVNSGDSASWLVSPNLTSYPTNFSSYQQIRIAVSSFNPDIVWASSSVVNANSPNDSIYIADGGSFLARFQYNGVTNNLSVIQNPTKISACNERMFKSGYGRDYSDIYVGATGSIFIMGLEAMGSSGSTGSTWFIKSKECGGARKMHVDAGKIRFNNGFIYACTDGGLFRQAENYTNGTLAWTDLTAGLEITQSYVHATSPQDAEMYMYANQDNGTHVRTSSANYNLFVGGDGTACEINPTNKNIFYGSIQNGEYLTRSENGVATYITPGAGSGTKDTATYSGSFVFGRAFMQQPFNNNYLLAAKRKLYVSSDKGTTWGNKTITGSVTTHYIARVSTTNNSNTIYVVEDGTIRFLRSTNYGNSWTDLTANKPYDGVISDIAISPNNDLEVYMSFYGNNSNAKLFRSINGGVSWSNLSTGLPNVDLRTIALTGDGTNGIYVGNDLGVYYRNNNLGQWISFSNSLPIVFVMNLKYDAVNQKISAATFGRGIWVSDDYNVVDCPTNLSLNSIYFNRSTYAASSTINSTGTIYADENSRITFSANNIIMSPGFIASKNGNFIAMPNGCIPNPILLRSFNGGVIAPPEKDIDGNIIEIIDADSNKKEKIFLENNK